MSLAELSGLATNWAVAAVEEAHKGGWWPRWAEVGHGGPRWVVAAWQAVAMAPCRGCGLPSIDPRTEDGAGLYKLPAPTEDTLHNTLI